MLTWEKTGRTVTGSGEVTITYTSDDGRFTIESRKRNIPHANGEGTWSHTTYVALWDGKQLAEKQTLKDAKEVAERASKCMKEPAPKVFE